MKAARKLVKRKIAEGAYQFESVPCAICGGEDFEVIATKDRYEIDNRVVICRDCGLIQTNPRMTAKSYREFYQRDYRQLYTWKQTIDEHFEHMAHRAERILNFVNQHTKLTPGKVLDVGCSSGGMLHTFKQSGYDVTGVDYDKSRVEYGTAKGLNIITGDVYDIDGKFDLIIYSHTLEHILDLKGELRQVAQLLNSGGYLFVDLPNMDYWLAYDKTQCLQNAHTYYFTPETLLRLMSLCGYVKRAAQNLDECNFMTLWQCNG
jgi:2-polyprenyl-3-methyl-5-hydroxy-6-metoxy-1,4-benzoquinol methylase